MTSNINQRKRSKKNIYLLSNNVYRIEGARQWGYSLPKGRFISFERLPEHCSSAYRSLRCFGAWSQMIAHAWVVAPSSSRARFTLSPCGEVCTFPQYLITTAPCRWLSRTAQKRLPPQWFFSPIPVRSSLAWGDKKRRIRPCRSCRILHFRKEVGIFLYVVSCIAPTDTAAKFGNNSQTCNRALWYCGIITIRIRNLKSFKIFIVNVLNDVQISFVTKRSPVRAWLAAQT